MEFVVTGRSKVKYFFGLSNQNLGQSMRNLAFADQ